MRRPSQVMVKSPEVLLDCCRLAIRAVGLAILMSETRVKFLSVVLELNSGLHITSYQEKETHVKPGRSTARGRAVHHVLLHQLDGGEPPCLVPKVNLASIFSPSLFQPLHHPHLVFQSLLLHHHPKDKRRAACDTTLAAAATVV